MATGTVKWFNPTKGYGFIQPQSGGKDVFVHISALERAGLSTLNEGATVDYEIVRVGRQSKGPQINSLYVAPLRRGFSFNVHVQASNPDVLAKIGRPLAKLVCPLCATSGHRDALDKNPAARRSPHMRFGSMQLRDVLSALQAHFFKCFKQTAQVFWSRFSCGLATKLLAADSHVLAFAAVTRASTKWQAR